MTPGDLPMGGKGSGGQRGGSGRKKKETLTAARKDRRLQAAAAAPNQSRLNFGAHSRSAAESSPSSLGSGSRAAEATPGGAGGASSLHVRDAPPSYPHALDLRGRAEQLKPFILDAISGRAISESWAVTFVNELRAGKFLVDAPVPFRQRIEFGPAPYCVPHFLCFIPELQFPGVSLPCPQCKRSDEVIRWSLTKARAIMGLTRPYGFLSTQMKCKRCNKKFNSAKPEVLAQMPLYVRDAFPLFLSRKSGVTKEVLQVLLGYRDENAVMSGAARILGRLWADEFVKTERTYLELLLSALKQQTGLGVGDKLVAWSCLPEFQLTREKFCAGVNLRDEVFFGGLWVDYHEHIRQQAMLRQQAALTTSALQSIDMSHKSHFSPFAGTMLVADNVFKTVSGVRLQLSVSQTETSELLELVNRRANPDQPVQYVATDKPQADGGMIDDVFRQGTAQRANVLRSKGLVQTLPPFAHGREKVLVTTATHADHLGVSLCEKAATAADKLPTAIDCEWVAGQQNPAEILSIAIQDDPNVYIVFLGEMRRAHLQRSQRSFRFPYNLAKFFRDANVLLISKQLTGDLQRLGSKYGISGFPEPTDIPNDRKIELGRFAKEQLSEQVVKANWGVQKMVEVLLQRHLSKERRQSRWDQRLASFSDAELEYCANDVLAHLELYNVCLLHAPMATYEQNATLRVNTFVDIVNRSGMVVALGRTQLAVRAADRNIKAELINVYREDESIPGGGGKVSDATSVTWPKNLSRPTSHRFPDDRQVIAVHGKVTDADELRPLPESKMWSSLVDDGWISAHVSSDGNCFVFALLSFLNRPVSWLTGEGSRVDDPLFRDAGGVVQRQVMTLFRRYMAEQAEQVNNEWMSRNAAMFDRAAQLKFIADIRGDPSSRSQPYLEQPQIEFILDVLAVCAVSLQSTYSESHGIVRHKVCLLGPRTERGEPQHDIVAVFRNTTVLRDDGGVAGSDVGRAVSHFEIVLPQNLSHEDACSTILQKCEINERDQIALSPYLPGARDLDAGEAGPRLFSDSIAAGDVWHVADSVAKVTSRKHNAYLRFIRAIRDAILIDLETDVIRVLTSYLGKEREGPVTAANIKAFRETPDFFQLRETPYWRARVRRVAPAGPVIEANLTKVMETFEAALDADNQSIVTPKVKKAILAACAHAREGRLSDPPHIDMYSITGYDEDNLPLYRSHRGSFPELIHQKMLFYHFGLANASPRLSVALLTEFFHRWNVRRMIQYGDHEDIGYTDTFELEPAKALSKAIRELVGDDFGELYSWLQSVDELPDSQHYIIATLPTSGEFDCLDPIRESKPVQLRPRDAFLARMFGLSRPIDCVTTKDERELFRQMLPEYIAGSALRTYDMACAWNRYIVENPEKKLYPKIPCLLDQAYAAADKRREQRCDEDLLDQQYNRSDLLQSMKSSEQYQALFDAEERIRVRDPVPRPLRDFEERVPTVNPGPTGFSRSSDTPISPVKTSKGAINSATDRNLTIDRRRSPRCAHCGKVCGAGRKAQNCQQPAMFQANTREESIARGKTYLRNNRRLPHETQCRGCLSLPRHCKCGSRRRKRDDKKLKKREKKSKKPKS